MNKLFMFFFFMFAGATILCGIGEGTAGIATTHLTTSLSATGTTVTVASTTDFTTGPDYVYIGDEKLLYSTKDATHFYIYDDGSTPEVDGRGYDGATAVGHGNTVNVKNDASNIMNSFLGYNVAAASTTFGSMQAIIMTGFAILKALPRVLMWDYNFLNEGWMPMVKYVLLYPLSIGFVASLMMVFIPLAWGLIKPSSS